MPYEWESESEDKRAPWENDGDSWRGEEQPADEESWTTEEAEPWDVECEAESDETDETDDNVEWRGNVHFADWPEELAGPEYWLYKRIIE